MKIAKTYTIFFCVGYPSVNVIFTLNDIMRFVWCPFCQCVFCHIALFIFFTEKRRNKVANKKLFRRSLLVKHTELLEVSDEDSAEAANALDSASFEDNAASIQHATAEVFHELPEKVWENAIKNQK